MILDSINLFSVKFVHLAGILNPFQVTVLFFVGNKTKEQISKRVLQENKARQNFRKTNIYPLLRIRLCVYLGVRNASFSENLACFLLL